MQWDIAYHAEMPLKPPKLPQFLCLRIMRIDLHVIGFWHCLIELNLCLLLTMLSKVGSNYPDNYFRVCPHVQCTQNSFTKSLLFLTSIALADPAQCFCPTDANNIGYKFWAGLATHVGHC